MPSFTRDADGTVRWTIGTCVKCGSGQGFDGPVYVFVCVGRLQFTCRQCGAIRYVEPLDVKDEREPSVLTPSPPPPPPPTGEDPGRCIRDGGFRFGLRWPLRWR